MAACIIFNPTARGDRSRKFREHLGSVQAEWVLKPTNAPGAARKLASEAVAQGFTTIIAAGGDGTLNEVVNGIADAPGGLQSTRLGVLPLGTVNVFAREIRLPLKPEKIWPILRDGCETVLDLGLAEFS